MACQPGDIVQIDYSTEELNESIAQVIINTTDIQNNEDAIARNALNIAANTQLINDQDTATLNSRVSANESDIATNVTNIATNTSNIATNTSNIATNTASISSMSTNTADIATNTLNIIANTTNITTNTGNIATNTSNISTNTMNISTNTSNIATNTSNISANNVSISANTSDIITNTADISTNTSNINTNTSTIATLPTTYAALEGNAAQQFAVADPTTAVHAMSKGIADSTYATIVSTYTQSEVNSGFLGISAIAYDSSRLGSYSASEYVLKTLYAGTTTYGLVQRATTTEANDGTDEAKYMTPKQVKDVVDAAIAAHIAALHP